jgi:hypothetical protein
MDIILERLKLNNIEADKTPYGHYYGIKKHFLDNSLCYTLYNSKGEKIPCMTRNQEKKYPKKSAMFASNRVKELNN